ncbi:MAG TPA: hypothetical protein V6D18_15830 [Thermosynechococcaceae cyanobacterium]
MLATSAPAKLVNPTAQLAAQGDHAERIQQHLADGNLSVKQQPPLPKSFS